MVEIGMWLLKTLSKSNKSFAAEDTEALLWVWLKLASKKFTLALLLELGVAVDWLKSKLNRSSANWAGCVELVVLFALLALGLMGVIDATFIGLKVKLQSFD